MNVSTGEQHIITQLSVEHGHEAKARDLLGRIAAASVADNGCLAYQVFQSHEQPGTFYIVDGWESELALQAHNASPQLGALIGELLPLLSCGPASQAVDRLAS